MIIHPLVTIPVAIPDPAAVKLSNVAAGIVNNDAIAPEVIMQKCEIKVNIFAFFS